MFPLDQIHPGSETHEGFILMPNPISESVHLLSQPLLGLLRLVIPIRSLRLRQLNFKLKPSWLQFAYNLASFISDIHSALPTFVAW